MSDHHDEALLGVYRNTIVLGLTSTIATFGNTLWVFFFPLILQGEGLTAFYIGAVYSSSALLSGVAQVPVGAFVDRFGRKTAVVLGTAIASTSMLVLAFSSNPVVLVAAFLLSVSIGGTFFGIGAWALIAESSKSRLATNFGAFVTMAGWTSIFGPALGGLLIGGNRSEVLLLSSFLFAVAATARAAFLTETLHLDSHNSARPPSVSGLKGSLREFRSNRPLLLLTGAYAIYNLFLTQISFVVPLYSTQVLKLSTPEIGLLFSVFMLVDSQSRVFFGWVADRFGYIQIILASWAGEMAFMIAFAYSTGQALPLVLFSVWVLFGAMDGPAISAVVGKTAKTESRGTSIGLFSTLPLLLSVPAVLGTGFLYSVAPQLPFFANLLLGAVAFILLLSYSSKKDKLPSTTRLSPTGKLSNTTNKCTAKVRR